MGFIEFLKRDKASADAATNAAGNDVSTVQNESAGDTRAKTKDLNADKIFIRNVAISFVGIIICIVMLTASSYAWFTTTIESSNTITSSAYKLEIEVLPDEGENVTSLTPTVDENGNYTYTLEAEKEYKITVTALTENTTGKTGYIKLRTDKMAESDTPLYSEQIDRGDTITFTVGFNEATEITIIEGWGTLSVPEDERDILNGDYYGDIIADGN